MWSLGIEVRYEIKYMHEKEVCRVSEILHTRQRDYGWEKTHMCMVFAHALDQAPSTPARPWCH
jgi:hypothetical protein